MSKIVWLFILFCGFVPAASSQSTTNSTRKTLNQPTEIQGYPCAKGYAWFFAGGKLEHCTVSRAISFGEATIPAGSWITLTADGKPRIAQMSHDTKVAGVTCMGGGVLGPAEGAMTAFYPSGKLKRCYLAGDQTVQGVPCMSGGFFADGRGGGAIFDEEGTLQSCKLTRGYGTQQKGERYHRQP